MDTVDLLVQVRQDRRGLNLVHSSIDLLLTSVLMTDIDECAGNDTVCDGNADCHDTDGSYWCECRPGFQGDGYNCTGEF